MDRRPWIALPALALGLSGQEAAYGDLEALRALRDTPVVAASRRAQSLLESPQAVEVITADQIRASGVFRLVDLLRLATAVQVWDETPTRANVSLRGLNPLGSPRTVQVLLDGVPLFNLMAAPLDLNGLPVPLEALDRIEIVRGPSSSLYGANAQMGVISLITKRARPGVEGTLRAGAADHRTFRGELFGAFGGPRLAFTVGAAAASAGDLERPLRVVGQPGRTIPQETGSRERQAHLRAAWTGASDRLWAAFGYGDAGHFSEVSRSPVSFQALTVLTDQSVGRETLQLGWARTWSPDLETEVHLQQKVYHLRTGALEALPGDPLGTWAGITAADPAFLAPRDFYRDRVREATFQATWSPRPDLHLVAGADAKAIQAIPNLTLGLARDHAESSAGAFLSLEVETGALLLSAGARAENESLGGSRTSPRVSAVWRLSADSSLRIGWYTSSRSPTVQERYSAIGDLPILPFVLATNPDLRPEEADSVEVGWRASGPAWSAELTLFRTTLRHLIAQVPVGLAPGGKTLQMYRNFPGSIADTGAELSLQAHLAPAWRAGLNLATSAVKDPIYGEDRQADFAPRSTANLWLRWERGAGVGFLGVNRLGGYTVSVPFGNGSLRDAVPATTHLQAHVGFRPRPALTLSAYALHATHAASDSSPLALANQFALRYTRREVGLQVSLRF